MKLDKLLLFFSLFFTLLLLFLINFEKPIAEGKITRISSDKESTKIFLEDDSLIWLKNKTKLELKKGNQIKVYGKSVENTNNTLIFAEKITCLNC